MKKLFLHFGILALALYAAAYMIEGVQVTSLSALLVATLVLGVVNALVRPVLSFFSFPLTLLTLGLFYLVVNAACFGLAALLVPGFVVSGFGPAVLGALTTSFLSWVLSLFLESDEEERERRERRERRRGRP